MDFVSTPTATSFGLVLACDPECEVCLRENSIEIQLKRFNSERFIADEREPVRDVARDFSEEGRNDLQHNMLLHVRNSDSKSNDMSRAYNASHHARSWTSENYALRSLFHPTKNPQNLTHQKFNPNELRSERGFAS